MQIDEFKDVVLEAGKSAYRDMPWRHVEPNGKYDPYKILVSEMMLQQTQVIRVIPKYLTFISRFPTIDSLARVSLADVLRHWSGLGYNRRAKYLHDASKYLSTISNDWTYEDLVACKGIGPNTAKAVLSYAYNIYEPFIETNMRTLLLHYLFEDGTNVTDAQLLATLATMQPPSSARVWYWACMDVGAQLKSKGFGNLNKASAYKKQAKFNGSLRQVRGRIIKILSSHSIPVVELKNQINDDRFEQVFDALSKEGLVYVSGNTAYLGGA